MTPALRPIVALMLVAVSTLAHSAAPVGAADAAGTVGTVDAVSATATPLEQTGDGAGSFAAQYVSHGVLQDASAALAAFESIRAGAWSASVSSACAECGRIDNGLVALRSHAGYRRGFDASGNGVFDGRHLKAGLNRKLAGGWQLALNYTRAYGAAASYDRLSLPAVRPDSRPAALSAGRRALVLSAARSF